jgi:hypothetical protein
MGRDTMGSGSEKFAVVRARQKDAEDQVIFMQRRRPDLADPGLGVNERRLDDMKASSSLEIVWVRASRLGRQALTARSFRRRRLIDDAASSGSTKFPTPFFRLFCPCTTTHRDPRSDSSTVFHTHDCIQWLPQTFPFTYHKSRKTRPNPRAPRKERLMEKERSERVNT